jgi:hypothetical protein
MKRLLFSFLLIGVMLPIHAQTKSQITGKDLPAWSRGTIVLQNGDTIQCDLRYSRMTPEGLLQVRDNENIITVTAKDAKAFSYFDEKKNAVRKFYAFTMLPDPTAPTREFFLECVYGNDHFSILNHRTIGYPYEYMEYSPFKRTAPVNKKYILDSRSGKLIPLSKENTLEVLQERKPEILSYIETNGLKFKSVTDYINVFEYHNSL